MFLNFTGLGDVSESLVNDQSLTPADFLDEQPASPKVSSLQGTDDTCCTSPKLVECNEFKTPLTSRYGNKASATPSLFSQDESVNPTPVSSECLTRRFFFMKYPVVKMASKNS